MDHPTIIRPREHAVFNPEKMGKSTLFRSARLLVGLNAFEPGQEHALHAHAGMDKVYHVLAGRGLFLLAGRELPMRAGELLVAPADVPHGIRNTGDERCWCWRSSLRRRGRRRTAPALNDSGRRLAIEPTSGDQVALRRVSKRARPMVSGRGRSYSRTFATPASFISRRNR